MTPETMFARFEAATVDVIIYYFWKIATPKWLLILRNMRLQYYGWCFREVMNNCIRLW
jgi:hypothetical protein